ncbi:mitosis entry checkpoint protein MEC3 (MEC3) [Vairimorpha necatrix]|uniref:Mitosis entry checkpoint protein MEC3 (MEC3) n=1 Tax=Vairimorpha necatrix TaxID=6039 RepID=A0AAX4JAL2_9MICR
MISFDNSSIVIKKLELLRKYASMVTVTKNSLTTKKMQIIFPDTQMLIKEVSTVTLKISDLIQILTKSEQCTKNKNFIISKYKYNDIEIEKKYKKFDEVLVLPCSEPNLSIRINQILILSDSDFIIKCDQTGLFEMSSNSLIETEFKLKNCTIINSKIENVIVKVKSRDLKILENFQNDKIFCFFSDYILVYILEDTITNIVMIPILLK